MNFFKIKTNWANAEFIVFKTCIASAFLIIGAHFHELVSNYNVSIFMVFAITFVWTMYLWLSKMKNKTD